MKKRFKHFIGGIKGTFVVLFCFLLFPLAKFILFKKNIWIVSERRNEARDNGYVFFQYVRTEHPEVNCFYAISKQTADFEKLVGLGNVIHFGSFKHFFYFCGAKYLICSTTQGFYPSYYLQLLRKKFHLWGKYVFLQHGITKDNQTFLYRKVARLDLFICGAKPEFDDIKSNYGYKDNEVAYTGFSRFDFYHNLTVTNKIVVMPTWRRTVNKDNIKASDYYLAWSSLLNDSSLIKTLKENNLKLYFYMHPLFQQFSHLFYSKNNRVIIADFENYDLQQLLKESKLMITDFSSVAFDFGYMKKPVIYYQYDENTFFESHYQKGYFDYRRDGFGPVVTKLKDLMMELHKYLKNDFEIEKQYLDNQKRFFPLYDSNNSKRIFDEICKL